MATSLTFEVPVLSDALQKAAKCSPTKGPAYDKAAGIVFESRPEEKEVVIKATNLDVTYEQVIPVVAATGDPAVWRIPTTVLVPLITSLPMSGNHVELIDNGLDPFVRVRSGKTVAKLSLFDQGESYPIFPKVSRSGMLDVPDFANRIEQVGWATDNKDGTIISGVYIDGKNLVATDKFVLAAVPCPVPLDHPVVVPVFTLGTILKSSSHFMVKAVGDKLHMSLDPETVASATIIQGAYPEWWRITRDEFAGTVTVSRQGLLDALGRMAAVIRGEKLPAISLSFNGNQMVKELVLDMETDKDRMRDTVDCMSDDWDENLDVIVNAGYLRQAVEGARSEVVDISFGKPGGNVVANKKVPLRVLDRKWNYNCWIMPIYKGEAGA